MPKKSEHEVKLKMNDDLFKDIQRVADDQDIPANKLMVQWLETVMNTISYGSNEFYCDNCHIGYYYKGFFLEAECPNCKD